jgi:hypothetical protein
MTKDRDDIWGFILGSIVVVGIAIATVQVVMANIQNSPCW